VHVVGAAVDSACVTTDTARRAISRETAVSRRTAHDYPPEIRRLFDGYVHGAPGAAASSWIVRYGMHMYPGAQHGFHNDTTPRYDEAAAKLSWQRTVEFFNRNLRGG
jgi:dienelactone hydrolase